MYYWFTPYVPLSLLQWYNLCLSYNSTTNDMIAVMDGHTIGRFNNNNYNETPAVSSIIRISCHLFFKINPNTTLTYPLWNRLSISLVLIVLRKHQANFSQSEEVMLMCKWLIML